MVRSPKPAETSECAGGCYALAARRAMVSGLMPRWSSMRDATATYAIKMDSSAAAVMAATVTMTTTETVIATETAIEIVAMRPVDLTRRAAVKSARAAMI